MRPEVILVIMAVSFVTSEELRCERIMVGACQNLVYDMTIASAPETALQYLSHGTATANTGANSTSTSAVRTWLDAERLITSLRPIIDSGCSKQALFLFCSSLFPLCSPTAPRPVHPCRSLCEQVRKDCFSDPQNSKLWPAYLDCRALPQPEKHELCMQVPSDATGSIKQRPGHNAPTYHLSVPASGAAGSSTPTINHDSVETVVKGWSISNLTSLLQHAGVTTGASASIAHTSGGSVSAGASAGQRLVDSASWSDRINSLLLPSVALPGVTSSDIVGSSRSPCPTNYSLEYDRCVPRCGPTIDALYSQRQKELVELWTLVLSAVCFIFTLTSLVSFWTKAAKLEYPDRPVLFMTLCYNLLGLCYLERTILHSPRRLETAVELMFLETPSTGGAGSVATGTSTASSSRSDCSITSQCLAYYILKHYLLLSASTWWLIFGLCWYLSTAKQWSCEALERKSGLFHVLAWVVPFAAPIGALLRGHIQRFELTGFCTARGFTELPVLLLLLLGAGLVSFALAALARLRLCWNQRAPHLGRVFGRVLMFAVCYLIPALSATICMMLERVDHELEPCIGGEAGEGCIAQRPPIFSLLPTVLRLALTLLGGGFVGVWLWSRQPSDADVNATKKSTQPSCYNTADLMLLKGGSKPGRALDECGALPDTGVRRTEGRPAPDDSNVILREAQLLTGRYKDIGDRRQTNRGSSRSTTSSPYRSRIDKSKAKTSQKVCYTYRPGSSVLSDHGVALRPPTDVLGSIRVDMEQRSPYAGSTGGIVSNGGYVPVRVHRSFRAVPMSMLTRI
ncbi:frizzled-3 [Anopheles maculipalpis]|uniref:frizzled-3 n=1 Tax=Anopheles maculipalpis TaxID=1496333 RepID=UPI0021597BE3|nr:frizzled-3 [Anopheles maculipalpis]